MSIITWSEIFAYKFTKCNIKRRRKITINSEIEPCSTGSGEVKDIFVSGYIQNISSKLELKLDIKEIIIPFVTDVQIKQ